MKAQCNSILNIAHRGGCRHATSTLTNIRGKKLGKTLSLPSFFCNVATLSKILIASSGLYIHKSECANSAAYK